MNSFQSNGALALVVANEATTNAPSSAPDDIVVEGVRKAFYGKNKTTTALDGINLTIKQGEFVSVVGPSGCGKSTLMRLIAGLMSCTEGGISVGQKAVKGPETNVGIVFQTAVLLEWRTIIENVLLQIEMRRLGPMAMYRERADGLLTAVGLNGFQSNYPHELSGGMQQRAAIVRALIHDPPRLLMDEPFGALDALTREQVRVDLEDLWLSTHKTVLFITHSIEEAVLLSDRVVVMSARPGTIDRIVDVNLPRPRGLAARRDPEFSRLCEEITDIFLSRGVLTSRGSFRAQVVES